MDFIKRTLGIAVSALLLTSFASCGSGSSSGSESATKKNLVGDIGGNVDESIYGAHMVQHMKDNEYVIDTEVDARFVTDDEAKLLAKAKVDLNVVVGLCVGHDSLFYKYAKGLTTTLITKDRMLAHNPAGALYQARAYYKKLLHAPVGAELDRSKLSPGADIEKE